jgi:hypothetical protein
MPLIECKCGNKTPFGRFCIYCQAPLEMKQDGLDALFDSLGFFDRARAMQARLERTAIVRIQVLKMPDDGSPPNVKELAVVEQGMQLFLYSSAQPVPIQLPPGTYTVDDLFRRQGVGTSVQAAEAQSWCCFCWVRTQPVNAVVCLPDLALLEESRTHAATDGTTLSRSIERALRSLQLTDLDNQLGGAKLQMELSVVDPGRLMETLVQDYIENSRQDLETEGSLTPDETIKQKKRIIPPPTEDARKGLLASLGRFAKWMFRLGPKAKEVTGPPSELINAPPFTLRHLYGGIQMEFVAAIQTAVRQLRAQDLYENRNNARVQVEGEIQRTMAQTLSNYGLAIARVAAFEFICPEYAAEREKASRIRAARDDLTLRQQTADINNQTADIVQDQTLSEETRQKDLQKARVRNQDDVGTLQDQVAAAAADRQRQADAAHRDHQRGQHALDTRQTIELEAEKKASELTLERRQLEQQQELKVALIRQLTQIQDEREAKQADELHRFLGAIKDLEADKIQLLLAARDPQLAVLWAAAKQHAGQQQVIELQREHQAQLKEAQGQSSAEMMKFMTQVAHLVAQAVGANRPAGATAGTKPVPPAQVTIDATTERLDHEAEDKR